MPLLHAYIPDGALSPGAERELVAKVTDVLLEHEGVDPANEKADSSPGSSSTARRYTWPARRAKSPRYLFVCQVPEGQYNDERRAAVTAAMTQAVADAEDGAWPHPESRVCVFTFEVPDGTWGGGRRIISLPDIYELAWPLRVGMDGEPRATAKQVLAERRQGEAEQILAAAHERAPA
jgi:phenylpyruvate tautomerase PptA (4-oxalocrotonate tautomerase family)